MKNYGKFLLAALALALTLSFNAQARIKVSGRITDSSTGKGIAGVAVTDGYSFVKTDAQGNYKIQPNPRATQIYYTTPADYQINLDAENHLPCFYGSLTSKSKQTFDFQLTPLADGPEKDFTLLMIGDPQCRYQRDADRYQNETMVDIKATAEACPGGVYAVTLGDVTFDNSGIWDRMAAIMSNVSVSKGYLPFFQCMGNHDHDSLVEDTQDDDMDDIRACALYESKFGPTDYSFDRGDAHIVVMDNIAVSSKKPSTKPNKQTWSYQSALTDQQLEWLRQDLANVDSPETKMLIFCSHSPLYSYLKKDNNFKEALSMMPRFRECHIMTGHSHTQVNHIYNDYVCKGGAPIYEHVHGTACGSWWVNNTNLCGTPCGYNVYTVSGANVSSWRFKGTGCPDGYQMRIYDGSQTYTGDKNIEYRWYDPKTVDAKGTTTVGFEEAKGALVAEVFDDDKSSWKLEMWVDGAKIGDFIRKGGRISNVALAAFYHNVQGREGKHWRGNNTPHFWYFTLPEGLTAADLESGAHTWEVRAVFTVPTNTSNVITYTCSHITRDYSEF